MKLTKKQLMKIIKEELSTTVGESTTKAEFGPEEWDEEGNIVNDEESPLNSRREMARIIADEREYKISDRALAAIFKIMEKAVRVKAEFGPEVWDIHGELVDQ